MKKLFVAMMLLMFSAGSIACDLVWEYDSSVTPWIDGYKFFQSGVEVGSAPNDVLTISCADAGLTPGPGPITMIAYRGTDESPQSDPAVFSLNVPGSLQINVGFIN